MASASSIDGLVSGMDTTSVVAQLMSLERRPVALLSQRKTTEQSKIGAYQALNQKLAALQIAADDLGSAARWKRTQATSSSTAVTASAGSAAMVGTYTFDVTKVATAQSNVTAATFASTASRVTTATSLTITKSGGTPTTVQVGDGSMASVISAINASASGVRASAIQTGAASFRLQLTSTTTGAASAFTVVDGVDAAPLGALQQQVLGDDAVIGVGDPLQAGYVTVTSATNTVTDLVPGVTLTLSAPASGVSVKVSPDTTGLADQVTMVVGTTNAILADIKALTGYDPATKRAGLLMGDPVVRELERRLRDQAAAAVGVTSPASAGVQLNRDGTIAFDRAKFEAAFAADPAAVARVFRPGATVAHPDGAYAALPGLVSFVGADDRTVSGVYGVKVTQAARQPMVRLSGPVDPAEDITLTVPGHVPMHVLAAPGDGVDELVTKVNAASASGGLGLVATNASGALEIRTVAFGSAPTLSVSTTGTMTVDPVVAGLDVTGTINDVAAVGLGKMLSAPVDDVTLRGLSVLVNATAADVVTASGQAGAAAGLFGNLAYVPGVAQRLDSLAGDAIRSGTGRLTTLITGAQDRVGNIDEQIAAYDSRLAVRELTLRRQFTNLESSLGKLKSQSTWLSGQLSSLSANSA